MSTSISGLKRAIRYGIKNVLYVRIKCIKRMSYNIKPIIVYVLYRIKKITPYKQKYNTNQ